MIRINLLNVKKAGGGSASAAAGQNADADVFATEDDKKLQQKAMIHIFAMLLPPVFLYLYEMNTVPDMLTAKKRLQTELNEVVEFNNQYQSLTEELAKFEEDRRKLNAQIGAVESLSMDRLKVVRVLDAIQSLIPEKAWLTKVNFEYEKNMMAIEGVALADADVTAFLEALSRSIHFKQVNLGRSQEFQGEDSKTTRKRFEIILTMEQTTWPQN